MLTVVNINTRKLPLPNLTYEVKKILSALDIKEDHGPDGINQTLCKEILVLIE